jgi:hypothetical protein
MADGPAGNDPSVMSTKGIFLNHRVTIEAFPSGALLEGTVQRDIRKGTTEVVGEVNRINKYGNQSACVKSPKMRLYCYCV